MLYNYKFKNFCSFYDYGEFNMIAPTTKVKNRFPDNYIESSVEINILKTAVIVGENAGGKSNFIRSIKFLKSLFNENQSVRAFKALVNTNNLIENPTFEKSTIQHFELDAVVNGYIYSYILDIDFSGIVEEQLYFQQKPKGVKKDILHAKRAELKTKKLNETKVKVSAGYDFESDLTDAIGERFASKTHDNMGLFVTKLALLDDTHAMTFTNWVNNSLYPEAMALNYDIYKDFRCEEDDISILKDERYLDILKMVDYSIAAIEIDDEKPYSKTKIKRKKEDGNYFSRELKDDSSGVREFFAWAVQIFRVVYEDKTILADEMDRVLNPILSDRIIAFINGKSHKGQFVFTTHNVLHLDLKNYMKEQIYFITKDKFTLNSEIYSLADFPEVRYETTKIYEFYMKGILGGTSFE